MSHHTRPERTIDGPAPVVIRVRAPEAEEIQRDAGGRRFVWRLDAEAGGYFRWFLDPDCRFKVDELTGELVLRGDDDGGDDDPSPAAKPADLRERIRAAKPESQTGPPPGDPDHHARSAEPRCGKHRGVGSNRKFGTTKELPEFNSRSEFFPLEFFRGGELRPAPARYRARIRELNRLAAEYFGREIGDTTDLSFDDCTAIWRDAARSRAS